MKRCIIILMIFQGLFNMVCGQSPSAAIDSLIKYRVITAKERPIIEKDIKGKARAYYRIAILRGLEDVILQNTYHFNPRKSGSVWFSNVQGHPNLNNRDSINKALRQLLEKINKAGLITKRIYTHALKDIDSGSYVVDIQLISHLAELSYRLEELTPGKLLPVAAQLHQGGIINDSSYVRLQNDIKNDKIESKFQLNYYCTLDKVFDMAKYPDDPDVWLEQLHRDIASMVPGLSFTNFSYTTIPDTSFHLPGIRFRVSLVCNGHVYKYTSLPINIFKSKQGKISPKDIFVEDFYRIFNKVLIDEHSPFQLHDILFSPDGTTDHNRFALIALSEEQSKVFMKAPNYSYMLINMNGYDPTLTSAKIDSAIEGWYRIGLFNHLTVAQTSEAIDDVKADDRFSLNKLLSDLPDVIYSLLPPSMSQGNPYADLLNHLALITHGAFNPTKITQKKAKGIVELTYLSNGKIHSYTFDTSNSWFSAGFPTFLKDLSREHNLPGKFYGLRYDNAVIYLTDQQHTDVIKDKLLDVEPDKTKSTKRK